MSAMTRREEAEAVAAGAWRADCMDDAEWSTWIEMNPTRAIQDALIAPRPCTDCPLGFAAEMRSAGRCNGEPGWVHPADDGPAMPEIAEFLPPPVRWVAIPAQVPDPIPALQEPVMAETDAVTTTHPAKAALYRLTEASRAAERAWSAYHDAELALAVAETGWQDARHELLAAQGAVTLAIADPEPPDDGHIHYHGQGASIDEAIADLGLRDAVEPTDDAPEFVTRRPEPAGEPGRTAAETRRALAATGGGPGSRSKLASGLTRRQEEVLGVVERHGGNRKAAAAELKVTFQTVDVVLEAIAKAGRLPAALLPKLPARFAQYVGA